MSKSHKITYKRGDLLERVMQQHYGYKCFEGVKMNNLQFYLNKIIATNQARRTWEAMQREDTRARSVYQGLFKQNVETIPDKIIFNNPFDT